MSEGSHFTSEVRQRAAVAVIEGMTIADVAAAYGVDRKTVRGPDGHCIGLTVERLDNSLGHNKGNCVLCCMGCQGVNHPNRRP